MVHTNQTGLSTHYVAEGDPIPTDLPDEVVFVGPGSGEETEEDVAEAKAGKPKPAAKAEPAKGKDGEKRA